MSHSPASLRSFLAGTFLQLLEARELLLEPGVPLPPFLFYVLLPAGVELLQDSCGLEQGAEGIRLGQPGPGQAVQPQLGQQVANTGA